MVQDIRSVLSAPTVDVPTVGQALGVGRAAVYAAIRSGDIPSIRVGRQYRVPSAKLREMLGLPAHEPKAA